ncbi:DUF5776 domain-containing protein [Lentilactobacillus sp. Marseille-Q4993]|uniref:DUF5776 domain-containing protein n=1 Tax=Lentilactobacillus sp. Marseille-Q4993 TaxID=3039492 RepID=UPI0024BCC31A|nr:DUF5776 domain-containing protein [Lentilactobacillus sp. Marseille-Q4993]
MKRNSTYIHKAIKATGLVVVAALMLVLTATQQVQASSTRTKPETFYVSQSGNDSANGTSSSSPWKSIARVNKAQFIPGDKILFQRGDTWKDTTLKPQGSGDANADITLSDYGKDADLPKLEGEGQVSDVILLSNQQHWTISNLDVSNQTSGFDNGTESNTNGAKLGDLRGIHITGKDVPELDGIHLNGLYVHDVSGRVEWASDIGLDGSTLKQIQPGVYKNAGWDRSKRTGGIVIESLKPSGDTPTIFKNVSLTNSVLKRNSYGAFTIKQWSGGNKGPQWALLNYQGTPPDYQSARFKPHENITVTGNYIDQEGAYNCNGVYVTSSKHVMVENNVIKNSGTCGIEINLVDDCIVQNNDVSGSKPKVGGADSNGIDADRRVSNTIFQYNYLHDNGDGFLICGFDYNGLIIRYNLLKDNTSVDFRDSVQGGFITIDNNVIYNTLKKSGLNFSNANSQSERWQFENNVLYNVNDSVKNVQYGSVNSKVQYSHNAYYGPGVTKVSSDEKAVTQNPKFVEAQPSIQQTGDTAAGRVKDFSGFKLQGNSPLINAGTPYVKNAAQVSIDVNGKDYDDQSISGNPEIGLYEYVASTSTSTSNSSADKSSTDTTSVSSSISQPTQPEPGTSVRNAKKIPATAAKRAEFVYGINNLYLYKTVDYSKNNRIYHYVKKPANYRPIFKVIDYGYSAKGRLRYKVQDFNRASSTYGKQGYITANSKYVISAYYSKNPTTVTVISAKGINSYRSKNLSGKEKTYKQGSILKVKGIIQHNLTTRVVLANGQYISANRKFVIAGKKHLVTRVRSKSPINLYKTVQLTQRVKHYKKEAGT